MSPLAQVRPGTRRGKIISYAYKANGALSPGDVNNIVRECRSAFSGDYCESLMPSETIPRRNWWQ